MKKLLVFTFSMLLSASLSFAQDTGDKEKGSKVQSGKKATKVTKAHKGGKPAPKDGSPKTEK